MWLLRFLAADSELNWDVVDEEGLTPAELAKQLRKDTIYNLIMQLITQN
jgi:hypothetical protein